MSDNEMLEVLKEIKVELKELNSQFKSMNEDFAREDEADKKAEEIYQAEQIKHSEQKQKESKLAGYAFLFVLIITIGAAFLEKYGYF